MSVQSRSVGRIPAKPNMHPYTLLLLLVIPILRRRLGRLPTTKVSRASLIILHIDSITSNRGSLFHSTRISS